MIVGGIISVLDLEKYMDKKQKLLDLIDKAGKGSIEAAEEIAVGYFKGDFGEKNPAKAKKWASYAAKHGSEVAAELLTRI
jgi:TPR repeat protein